MTTPIFIAPTLADGSQYVPFVLLQPFRDPTNSFRAQSVADMYRVVPHPAQFYDYSLGADPGVLPVIFTLQNRTFNATLEVKLTLPSYLRVTAQGVGPVGAPPTNPFVIHLPPRATSDGLVNFVVTFDEAQALTFNPGRYVEGFSFDVAPLSLTGPVFVDLLAQVPPDLNIPANVTASLAAAASAADDSGVVEVPIVVEKMVLVPDLVPRWVDGTDGILKSGSAPAGWAADTDGRYYPPITIPDATGPEAKTGLLGLFLSGSATQSFTPLESLVAQVSGASETFIGATRRGFIIDVGEFLQGVQPQRVVREAIPMMVGDIGKENQFQILDWSDRFNSSQSVPDPITDARTQEFFQFVNTGVEQVRSGSFVFSTATARQWMVSSNAKKILDTNERYNVPTNLSEDDVQIIRSIGTVCSIVRDITQNGAGAPVKK